MKLIIPSALLLFILLTGCHAIVYDSPPRCETVVVDEPCSETVVEVAPPAPREEIIVWESRPSPAHVWVSGHWSWRGGRWVWIGGYWGRCPHGPGWAWKPGCWVRRGGRWHWQAGIWVRA